jgi:hypothetical protein
VARSEFLKGLNQGREEGKKQTRKDVLDWLENEYLKPEIVRETPEAKAILTLANELSKFLKVESDGS